MQLICRIRNTDFASCCVLVHHPFLCASLLPALQCAAAVMSALNCKSRVAQSQQLTTIPNRYSFLYTEDNTKPTELRCYFIHSSTHIIEPPYTHSFTLIHASPFHNRSRTSIRLRQRRIPAPNVTKQQRRKCGTDSRTYGATHSICPILMLAASEMSGLSLRREGREH